MSRRAPALGRSAGTSLLRDTRGAASVNMLSFAPLWFVVFSVFMMNVQLGRNYLQRDVVDHATALAADTAGKTVCADDGDLRGDVGALNGARLEAVRASIAPVLALVTSSPGNCKLSLEEGGPGGGAAGTMPLEVKLVCEFPCDIPIAAQAMCSGSPRHVTISARQTTVAMGCDVRSRG